MNTTVFFRGPTTSGTVRGTSHDPSGSRVTTSGAGVLGQGGIFPVSWCMNLDGGPTKGVSKVSTTWTTHEATKPFLGLRSVQL